MKARLRSLIISDVPEDEYRQRGGGNYLDKLQAMAEAGLIPPGTYFDIDIRHDDWCRLLKGRGPCDCDPSIQVREDSR